MKKKEDIFYASLIVKYILLIAWLSFAIIFTVAIIRERPSNLYEFIVCIVLYTILIFGIYWEVSVIVGLKISDNKL